MDNILNNLVGEIVEEEIEEVAGDDVDNIADVVVNAPLNPNENIINDINNAIIIVEGNPNNNLNIQPRQELISIPNYFEEVIPAYSERQFYEHFRMNRNVFEELVGVIEPRIENLQEELPLRKKMLITIWVLATPDSFRSIADRFGLSKTSTHAAFKEIGTILASLVPDFVKWPNADELEEIEEAFRIRSRNRFPGIVGAIDGCHIQIKQPPHNANDYYNRKETHSVILQGTCDHTGKFINVLIGRPGRCHDAAVFRSSSLFRHLFDPDHPLLPDNKHLLGDSAYPLSLAVLTPFRDNGHLNNQENRYNITHASCRSIIERAFGLLKVKFRRLYYLDVQSVRMANLIIAACCTLHNFILMHDQANIWDNINMNDIGDDDDNEDHNDEHDDDNNGVDKRNRIMNLM